MSTHVMLTAKRTQKTLERYLVSLLLYRPLVRHNVLIPMKIRAWTEVAIQAFQGGLRNCPTLLSQSLRVKLLRQLVKPSVKRVLTALMVSKNLVKSAAFAILETSRTSLGQLHANSVLRAVTRIQSDRIRNVLSASMASRSH